MPAAAYTILLYLHLLGAITLFSTLSVQWIGSQMIRGATRVETCQFAIRITRRLPILYSIGTTSLLLAGAGMVSTRWAWNAPWVIAALVTVVTLALIGTFGNARRQAAALDPVRSAPPGPIPPTVRDGLHDPLLWRSENILFGIMAGALWLMAARPASWIICVAALAAGAAIGLLVAHLTMHPAASD